MYTLVIYDIPDDRLRNRVAKVCNDYGLERIQWSAFAGPLSQNRRQELYQKLRRTLGRKPGNIQLYPVGEKELRLRQEISMGEQGQEQASRIPPATRKRHQFAGEG